MKWAQIAGLGIVVTLVTLSCASGPSPVPSSSSTSQTAAPNAAQARAQALVQGTAAGQTASGSAQSATGQAAASASTSADQPPPAPGVMTPEEGAFLQNYLIHLNYMVYYNEEAKVAKPLAKLGVSQANRYLIEKLGLSVIDFDQIEKNKKDQQAAYQSETGGSIDMIQFLAQKFNADVYVEIDLNVGSETKDGKYYANAAGTMKIFDTSTATLLGSTPFQSPTIMMPNSLDAAAQNAVASAVWAVMPRLTDQAKELVKNSLARGIRYEVVIQKTPDSKMISNLRRALAKKLRDVEQVSYSPNETKLNLYSFQKADKIEDVMYEAAAAAGMNDLNLIYSRGKSFTFSSGL